MKKISMVINADDRLGHISPEIYGHFSEHLGRCIYNGIYVGENSPIPNTDGIRNDIIEALRNIKAPVFRWPGGCFAEEYHWQDGIGEKSLRRKIVNTNWGGVTAEPSRGNSNTSVSAMKTGAAEEICVPNITLTFIKGIRHSAAIIRETNFTE